MEQEIYISKISKILQDFCEKNNYPYIILGKKLGKRFSCIKTFGKISIVGDFYFINLKDNILVKIEKKGDIDFKQLENMLNSL